MLSPRSGLPVPDPDLAYTRMVQHTKDCTDCLIGRECAESLALLKAWGDADVDMAVIEADLDAQLKSLME